MLKRFKRRRKDMIGAPVHVDPKHPKANCHVFRVKGKEWTLIPGHHFFREAVRKAQNLSKNNRDPKAAYLVRRKRMIVWPYVYRV